MYLLDEPTTGLHFDDLAKLLEVLNRLVDHGNSVVVIEHNLDVIKTADWIVDMGPEGGSGGGKVVATGTPEQVADISASHTGGFLRELLAGRGPKQTAAARPSAAKRTTVKRTAAKRTTAKSATRKPTTGKATPARKRA
jgi:excinuclease ABC subunit A